MPARTPETTVWQGTPSPRADLPAYLGIALGGVALTLGLVVLGNGMPEPAVGERDPGRLVAWAVGGVWIVCALLALGVYLRARATRYLITTQRLRITTGLLSTATEEVELRRIRDSSVVKPFFLRLLGLGNVVLVSDDKSAPRVVLRAVHGPDALQSRIRELVQELYAHHGVREIDVM